MKLEWNSEVELLMVERKVVRAGILGLLGDTWRFLGYICRQCCIVLRSIGESMLYLPVEVIEFPKEG